MTVSARKSGDGGPPLPKKAMVPAPLFPGMAPPEEKDAAEANEGGCSPDWAASMAVASLPAASQGDGSAASGERKSSTPLPLQCSLARSMDVPSIARSGGGDAATAERCGEGSVAEKQISIAVVATATSGQEGERPIQLADEKEQHDRVQPPEGVTVAPEQCLVSEEKPTQKPPVMEEPTLISVTNLEQATEQPASEAATEYPPDATEAATEYPPVATEAATEFPPATEVATEFPPGASEAPTQFPAATEAVTELPAPVVELANSEPATLKPETEADRETAVVPATFRSA